jgi:hypothetical protein
MSWIITGTQRYQPDALLDQYPGAAAAYSLRNLVGTSNPAVVRVRRDNDDAEDDFTATEVSDGTLAAWVGAGNDGFVRTWYDQSGNNRHCQQSTTSAQPSIVLNGALQAFSGKPSLNFATNKFFDRITTTTPLKSFSFLGKAQALNGTIRIVGSHVGVGSKASSFFAFGTATSAFSGESLTFFDGDSNAFLATSYAFTNNQDAIASAFFTANNDGSIFVQDSTGALIRNTHDVKNADFQIGKRINLGQYYNSLLPELVMWSVDYKTDASAIHANINAHYSIY